VKEKHLEHSQAFRDFPQKVPRFPLKIPRLSPEIPRDSAKILHAFPRKSSESSENFPGIPQLSPAISPAFFEASPAFS
jgi:hypothetical protein